MRSTIRLVKSPQSGLPGEGFRFGVAGGLVACVYLLGTLFFSHVAGLPFQAALAVGFGLALVTHFTLQRKFVWVHRDAFALPIGHQATRYLAISLTQYGLTALATSTLPSALGAPTDIVYLATTACLTITNFILFRTRVFHAEERQPMQERS